jgi:predicted NACHT family NTPase
MLDICEIVSSQRGIELPHSVVESTFAEGRVAIFFDGLDEVGYIDKRIALLTEIDNLVKTYAPRGNRFVLASRPAAVQPVDIPEAMTYLHLKGLTEEEIRTLAGRVLTVRLGEHEDKVLTTEEADLVERLLDDTRNKPGIARIARNPLLVTLLVLTYASTGALSARRHVIYTQAIKTLISVRGRQTREQQLSEADLRIRLGSLALGIFQREIAEIPKRSEVLEILSPLMPLGTGSSLSRSNTDAANAFIQEVAEATGLLTIHLRNDQNSEDLITFMHYSFLEYYAAAGLLSRDYKDLVTRFASWNAFFRMTQNQRQSQNTRPFLRLIAQPNAMYLPRHRKLYLPRLFSIPFRQARGAIQQSSDLR